MTISNSFDVTMAMQSIVSRQQLAVSLAKATAEADRAVVTTLMQQAVDNAKMANEVDTGNVVPGRGENVNIKV
ncbi:MAG: hypothetical protein IKD08_06190 [Alphaproteobacteria bacterium]|nr:hypothetical protein [Alphaproteobacteria bacterium]